MLSFHAFYSGVKSLIFGSTFHVVVNQILAQTTASTRKWVSLHNLIHPQMNISMRIFDSSKTVRFEMLMAVNMKITVFLDVTPFVVVNKFQYF